MEVTSMVQETRDLDSDRILRGLVMRLATILFIFEYQKSRTTKGTSNRYFFY